MHQMQKNNPNGKFYPVPYLEKDGVSCVNCNDCPFMKLNTMEKIYLTLKCEDNEIFIPEETRQKAENALNKMLELSI